MIDLHLLHLRLSQHLERIKSLMPEDYRVTLVLRSPAMQAAGKSGDVVIGDDDPAEAAAAITRTIDGGKDADSFKLNPGGQRA